MPLHLLGKKSWNVYNPENIARVRRDEAQAKAQEEEYERRMQEVDAERRIQILRGERPPTPPPSQTTSQAERRPHADYTGGHKKRRRLAGENDTDRDIRFAREDAELALAKREQLVHARRSKNDAPLHDSDGHINLFPEEKSRKRVEKNPEVVREAADKQRSYGDQYTMRFSNATGFCQDMGKDPWYSSLRGDGMLPTEAMPSKDVWGNEDPLRREREKARMNLNDPLAAMKKGIRQLKSVEEQRKKWNQERSRELDALKSAEKARLHHRRRRSRSEDSLENFRLDDSPDTGRDERDRRSARHHRHSRDKSSTHSERRRSRSRSGSRSHHHRSHNHRHRDHDRRDSRRREAGANSKHRT
ncbi:hypothetical protein BDW68DRAFT_51604 [Aspergillus falconensis]